jgi:GT2 family glycosyltransferase
MNSVCLAILNYNGRKHLEHLLPTACAAAKNYPGRCSVLVLDNRSPEPDVDWVRREFPSVQVVVAAENDFLFSYNWLLPQLSEEIVVILNNDLRLEEHFLAPLLRHFTAPDVFAVSASSYDWEGRERTIGPARLTFQNGFYDWRYEPRRQELCHTLFASGGFMAVDRRKFLELGGFNRLFHPAYCEDLDLGFRAWRRGWRSLYEPASVVWHREHASWEVSTAARPNHLHFRHGLLFQWASLPLNRDRLTRYWSIAKLGFGGLFRGQPDWLLLYPRLWWEWQKIRRQHAALKISDAELDRLQTALLAPVKLATEAKVAATPSSP